MAGLEDPFKFLSIIWLDIVLSGDNALIIGLAASSLSPKLRRQAILYGLVLAAVMRIIFASMATFLMHMPGLLFVGGVALLWVSWRLYKELRAGVAEVASEATEAAETGGFRGSPRRTLATALFSITVADLSMSIDNVLAVAAIARDNLWLLVFGLVLSIALMGLCATLIVKVLVKRPWISYIGVALLVFVGAKMLWDGWPSFAGLIGFA